MRNLLFMNIGIGEIVIIALVILLLFGGKKIPELMKGLGKGVKSFKDGLNEKDENKNDNSAVTAEQQDSNEEKAQEQNGDEQATEQQESNEENAQEQNGDEQATEQQESNEENAQEQND